MLKSGRKTIRYSSAFKQKVVNEIEQGELTIGQAKLLYDIRGGETIQKWVTSFGKDYLLNKVVRIEMRDEKDRLKELKKENTKLAKAIAKLEIEKMALEELLQIGKEKYGIDLKKKSVSTDVAVWLRKASNKEGN